MKVGSGLVFLQRLLKRVRRCEYKQFWWDILPETGSKTDSIMRLDQVQPVGRNHSIVEVTNYCLSETGLIFMEQFLEWFSATTDWQKTPN